MKQLLLYVLLITAVCNASAQTPSKYPTVDIPFKKFVLENGLTLIVHEDHKAPIAAFNIWYHVGSKNEKPGKTGFAHLFEHLMFNGSEHYDKDYFQLMDSIGATDLNGTTNTDRTNYFENFPVAMLEKVLWIESDRMGFMLGAIDTAKLNEQRGVVQNEKRQGENHPHGIAYELTTKSTYPANHPYSWTVIGSMEDLNAASLDDVKEWFRTYYGPNNAVICIAGDVNADSVHEKVKKYFGDIPPGPPVAKHKKWIAKRTGTHFQEAEDRVPQARVQKVWNVPGWGTQEVTHLNLLSAILTNGKSSRLYKRLVYDDQIASNVYSYTDEREIGGQFFIVADAKPGIDLEKLNSVIDEELKKVLTQGVNAAELERMKTEYFADFIKGIERIGGFGGKSDILAQNATYGGDAGYFKTVHQWIKSTTVADIKKAAVTWLQDGEFVLNIHPYPQLAAGAATIDRTRQPEAGASAEVQFPAVKAFKLSNGLNVALVERKAVPVVTMSLMFDAGYSADKNELAGLASVAGRMMPEGTKTRSSLQISDQLADLGATFNTYSDVDNTYLNFTSLRTNIDASLGLFMDILMNPSFPQKDFERVQKNQLLQIKQEEARPVGMGLRVLPAVLYGSDHAYSKPFTGSGTEESVNRITRQHLVDFHDTWVRPNNGTLVVVGDITENELKGKLEKFMTAWKPKEVPKKNIAPVALPASPRVFIIDKPGALQSIIFAAEVSVAGNDPDYEAINMANKILGGEFTSRINMNLRENKHWSYGSFSINLDAKAQGFFTGYAPVQTDKTKESVAELLQELTGFVGDKPATEQEFVKVKNNSLMQLPGSWETNDAVRSTLAENIKYQRGAEYLKNYPQMLRALKLTDLHQAAKKVIKPQHLTWVIVGDRSKIEKGIRELNLGPVKFLDVKGNEIK